MKQTVYVVTAQSCDGDANDKRIVKILSNEDKANKFRDKMEKEDKKLQKELLCDPTEYEVEPWVVE